MKLLYMLNLFWKLFFVIVLFRMYGDSAFAQLVPRHFSKPPLDTSVLKKWPSVQSPAISNNGRYFSFTTLDLLGNKTLTLKSIYNDWSMTFEDIMGAFFTNDSRSAVLVNSGDSLCLITLGSSSIQYIPHVKSFKLFTRGKTDYIAYHKNTTEEDFNLWDLAAGSELTFKGIKDYLVSKNGSTLILLAKLEYEGQLTSSLKWVDIGNKVNKTIWVGRGSINFIPNDAGTQLAFEVEEQVEGKTVKSFWYYLAGTNQALLITDDQSSELNCGLQLSSITGFSADGTRLFITLKEKDRTTLTKEAVSLDVWNYKDPKLQSRQLYELSHSQRSFAAVINLKDRHIIRLEQDDEELRLNNYADAWGVLTYSKGDESEWYWNENSRPTFYLESTVTGERKKIGLNYPYLLPDGKYLVGADSTKPSNSYQVNNYFVYNVETGQICNVSKALPKDETEQFEWPVLKSRDAQLAGWINNGEYILIYDKYDIWRVDPSGKEAAVNLTNGYGRKHGIVFRLTCPSDCPMGVKDTVILTAFDLQSKKNGFYRAFIGKASDPEILSMEAFLYCFSVDGYFAGFKPIKARDTDSYIVQRQSASSSPNYFITSDFRTFKLLTNVYPEKKYNWLTSELITFKALDGRLQSGILYKPENFNPKAKYPTIFFYYEKYSNTLNEYKAPEPICDNINIPWFVSHGYIVFVPDIYYMIGEPGRSAYNAVMGALKYVSKFSWIDSTRLGIQGHSFGGFETKYILTHSRLFAAAMASSGMSDLISDYGDLWNNGTSKQGINELGQNRMNTTPWVNPNLYIENSPLFKVDNVTTPVLLMNNKNDGGVGFTSQGVSFFTALRRLGKRAWMLQYDHEGHSLDVLGNDAMDFTLRMTQFFNHYLKGFPAPKWMAEGIPAKLKGISYGLELEDEHTSKAMDRN